MNSKKFIIILWIITISSLAIVLIFYIINFYTTKLSSDPAIWGQFGDYLGGTLNPIFALLNLIVLTYLTIKIVDIEHERNQFTLQELARPLGDIITERDPEGLNIRFRNCGLGPLKVKKITINYDGKEYDTFEDILPTVPSGKKAVWSFWQLHPEDEAIIPKESEYSLVKIENKSKDGSLKDHMSLVYKILRQSKVTITYTDMYDRLMPVTSVDYKKLKE
jgi:uncharacterized membrane protein